nr:hypothetical protein BaRGS_024500 [Batillaria attramentaria]
MSIALLIGSVGNVLILVVIGAMRNLQKTGKIFIMNLALADLCVAAIADPMCIVGVVKGEQWFDDKLWLCETIAAFCLTACFCAFLSLTLASLNRYVFICHNTLYDKFFRCRYCYAACVMCWIMAFLFEFPNFLGWGGHTFDEKNHQCIWDRTQSLSYTMFVALALIGGPLVIMLICYILIFKHIYKTKLNLYVFEEHDPYRMLKTWKETLRTARMLLGIFFVFLICWTPYAIVIVFDFYQALSQELHLFVTMLAHLHSSCNCIVYTFTNRNFRVGVLRMLGCADIIRGSESEAKSSEIAKISSTKVTMQSQTSSGFDSTASE